MKVLWAILIEFPPLAEKLGHHVPASCGWLYASATSVMKEMLELELGVVVYSYGSTYEEYEIDGVKYYMIPSKSMAETDKRQIEFCKKAIKAFKPDLIHIHGTEHSLAQAMVQANVNNVRILANIQGMASGIAPFADGDISFWEKLKNITPLDFYRNTFLFTVKREMYKRAKCESAVIRQITDITGRTQWDYDHAVTINPNIQYHFLNETLRDSFYEGDCWSLDKCKRHTIFVSNSGAPLKGAHQILKALPIILDRYPDTIVNFCGINVMNSDLKLIIRFQGYHLYLRKLVKKLKLQNHVSFLGTLSERQMKQAFLDANVYVMPSAIENSPNSLCEAQIMGVPVVASYCGGTPSLIIDGETGFLYRYEEYVQLAQLIIRLFEKKDFSMLSRREQDVARIRHNRKNNSRQLIDIYNKIMKKDEI